jgi:hypothetical protein
MSGLQFAEANQKSNQPTGSTSHPPKNSAARFPENRVKPSALAIKPNRPPQPSKKQSLTSQKYFLDKWQSSSPPIAKIDIGTQSPGPTTGAFLFQGQGARTQNKFSKSEGHAFTRAIKTQRRRRYRSAEGRSEVQRNLSDSPREVRRTEPDHHNHYNLETKVQKKSKPNPSIMNTLNQKIGEGGPIPSETSA